MKKLISPALLTVLLLAGCSPAGPADLESAPTPTPTPVEATPQQVASVIAQYVPDWQKVVDGSNDCRFTWVLDKETPAGKVNGMACYHREQTIGTTAQLVLRDWSKLKIPASMSSIVGSTSKTLQAIAAIDLKAVCGEGSLPAETPECTSAIGSRNFLYTTLKGQLAAWSPYL
ncbi:MAG: hypothetical protein JSS52_11365 [Proteobacteria bacterium]|nr:hypothetical protein [Pseudomonadota bacterium]